MERTQHEKQSQVPSFPSAASVHEECLGKAFLQKPLEITHISEKMHQTKSKRTHALHIRRPSVVGSSTPYLSNI